MNPESLPRIFATIFRPVYVGKSFQVRPQRWWSRKDRKAARIALKVADCTWVNAAPGSAFEVPNGVKPEWRAKGENT